jgi:glycerophosphoryl diester phosphodiesterase
MALDRRCLVIAHRGASGARPENTVEAFRHARELAADWVELDVRVAADGALVVHHDAHLADGRAIAATRSADLPDHVPDLAAALAACAGMGVNVEIKNDPSEPGFDERRDVAVVVARAVRAALPPEGVIVSSFDLATVDRLHVQDPDLPTGVLTFALHDPLGALAAAVAGGHRALHPWDPMVDERLVAGAHQAGLAVYVWTVDDPARMAALVGFGVDGIITNHPDRARAVVDAAG